VRLITPKPTGASDELVQPGTIEAWTSARLFARVPGYVRAWYADIGAKVAAGAPLGAIDTPELDQQIIQARATLVRVKAEATLARTTAARWTDLLKSHSVSQQETDEKRQCRHACRRRGRGAGQSGTASGDEGLCHDPRALCRDGYFT
jgi:multidrug efflux pump subunit AcrA (membrane-fusion protein)